MSEPSKDLLYELLVQSLATWQVLGSVERTASGALFIRAGAIEICIERAPKHLPFRWMVSAGGRKRGALSIVAVLRRVRAALDPGFVPNNRVRIAVSPSVSS